MNGQEGHPFSAGLMNISGWWNCTVRLPMTYLPFPIPLQDYVLMRKILLQQLVRTDVACRSLCSSHPTLVSRDALDTAVTWGDAIDGHTPWKQGMGLGCSHVVLQQRINP